MQCFYAHSNIFVTSIYICFQIGDFPVPETEDTEDQGQTHHHNQTHQFLTNNEENSNRNF